MSKEKTLIGLTDAVWQATAALDGARHEVNLAMVEIIRCLSELSKAASDLANLPKPRK